MIPVNWISSVTTNGIPEYMCKWPSKQRVTTMMLMKGDKPSADWKSYPVNVIERFGTIFIFLLQNKRLSTYSTS